MPSVNHRITLRDGEQLFVRDLSPKAPAEPRQTLLLLHGFGSDSASWLPFAVPLSRHYRVVMPDLRGFGHSHEVNYNRESALDNHIDDVADVIEALGLDNIALAGLSMGALTSLMYLRKYGSDKVSRYCNIDQAPKPLNGGGWHHGLFGKDQDSMLVRMDGLREMADRYGRDTPWQDVAKADRRIMLDGFGRFFSYAVHRRRHKLGARALMRSETLAGKVLPTSNWPVYIDCMQAYLNQDYDVRAFLPSLDIPVTIMVGLKSPMYPVAGQRYLHNQLPNSRLVEFPRAGHAVPLSRPLKFYRELSKFLAAEHEQPIHIGNIVVKGVTA